MIVLSNTIDECLELEEGLDEAECCMEENGWVWSDTLNELREAVRKRRRALENPELAET